MFEISTFRHLEYRAKNGESDFESNRRAFIVVLVDPESGIACKYFEL